ncbi:MAG: glucokinase [Acidobacteriota bacterium]
MILAGDIGGTSTRLGLFAPGQPRPQPVAIRVLTTLDFDGLAPLIGSFLAAQGVESAAIGAVGFGVAGPVIGDVAQLTNVPWRIDARQLAGAFGFAHVRLMNDLQAMAQAVPVLADDELHTLQRGSAQPDGNIALIAAGTGLGVATLHNIGGRFVPAASESGHADYAARTEDDIAVLRDLVGRYGRAEVEHVVSGHGLVNIHRVMHRTPCAAGVDLAAASAPAAISAAALSGRCAGCVKTLGVFVEAYGAEAGNLALRAMATGGVYVGGGIAPKILPALTTGSFMAAFLAKGAFGALLGAVPVHVVLNDEAGLLGAAVGAAEAAAAGAGGR